MSPDFFKFSTLHRKAFGFNATFNYITYNENPKDSSGPGGLSLFPGPYIGHFILILLSGHCSFYFGVQGWTRQGDCSMKSRNLRNTPDTVPPAESQRAFNFNFSFYRITEDQEQLPCSAYSLYCVLHNVHLTVLQCALYYCTASLYNHVLLSSI